MSQRIAGVFLGFMIGSALSVGVTALTLYAFFRTVTALPNPAVNHVYGELMFWALPLLVVGLGLMVLTALVGWPVVGLWIGRRAANQEQAQHRRSSLFLGGGLGLTLALWSNLAFYFHFQLAQPWVLLLSGQTLLHLGAGLFTGYLMSLFLWRPSSTTVEQAPTAADRLTLSGQLLFLLFLPLLVCIGGVWLATIGWRTADRILPSPAERAQAAALGELGDLPVGEGNLRSDDLLLVQGPEGVLALQAGQTELRPWKSKPEDLAEILRVPYAQFGHRLFTADGGEADLSELTGSSDGAVLVSPDGRHLAYEVGEGPALRLRHLESGEDLLIHSSAELFCWTPDSRYLYLRAREKTLRFEPEATEDRLAILPQVNPQGDGWPAILATSSDGLVWRASSALNWCEATETARNVRLGATRIDTPFVLSPDTRSLAWIRVLPPQLMVQKDLPGNETQNPLLVRNNVYHLAWSPQGDRLVIWAETGCQPGLTSVPNPELCPGDLYLVDLGPDAEPSVTRLTNSDIGFLQVTGLRWLQRQ